MKATIRLNRRTSLGLTALLVMAALALGFMLFRSSATTRVLIANADLPSGQILNPSDFAFTDVRIGQAVGYLTELPGGQMLQHPLQRGELLNQNDITNATTSNLVRFALSPTEPLAQDVRVGSLVSIWFMPNTSATSATATTKAGSAPLAGMIASGVQVLSISKTTDSFGSSSSRLEVSVAQELLPALISIRAAGGSTSVVAQD